MSDHAISHQSKGDDPVYPEDMETRDQNVGSVLTNLGNNKVGFESLPELSGPKGDQGEKGEPGKDGNQELIVLENQITNILKKGYVLISNGKGGWEINKVPDGDGEVINIDNSVYAPSPDPYDYETIMLGGC